MNLSLRKKLSNLWKNNFVFVIFLGLVVFATLVGAVTWVGSGVIYHLDEDTSYYHNLSANITGFNSEITFAIDTDKDIIWTNSSGVFDVSPSIVSGWIKIYDSSNGNLTINATHDNQTGFFKIQFQAFNTTSNSSSGEEFEFQVNATNDAPTFDSPQDVYNWTEGVATGYIINVSDEELHYPINFTLNATSCSHAEWSGREENISCNIFNITNVSNTTAYFNLTNITPGHDDVGTYTVNITINDSGASCPHAYCVNSTYNVSKSTFRTFTFNVFSILTINVTACANSLLTEDSLFYCEINITTKEASEDLDISSEGFFRNVPGIGPFNSSFFKASETMTSDNHSKTINVSLTPTKRDVGNWTINFSADPDSGSSVTEQIYIFVNWTEENVSISSIDDITIYENKTFYINGTDNDLLIRDSSVRSEDLTFASNVSWVNISWNRADKGIDDNFINATVNIDFDDISTAGDANYSVLINVTDVAGNMSSTFFTVEILDDVAALWNSSKSFVNFTNEGDEIYVNLSEEYVQDPDGDALTFSYISDSEFSGFNLTTTGIINFTSSDIDVGYHNVTINASDGKLDSLQSFNFTIKNVADSPSINILYVDDSDDTAITESSQENGTEDAPISFILIIDDEDFLIPSGQETFYNETLTVSTVETNSTGSIVDLFSFSLKDYGTPNSESVRYNASFTPTSSQVDNYTILISITDNDSNSISRTFYFNISSFFDPPVLEEVGNQGWTINDVFYFEVNATDEEDDAAEIDLNYTLNNLTIGGDFLTINLTTGLINFTLSSSHEGFWEYNLSVNDSDGGIDSELFNLSVYGVPTLNSPPQNILFNLTENVSSVINFTLNHSVGDNLTYEFYIDSISCAFEDNSDCDYTSMALRDIDSSFGNSTAYNWSFTPNFTDETYELLNNLTLSAYPNTASLNSTQADSLKTNFTFKLNISHTNHIPIESGSLGPTSGTFGDSSPISIDLTTLITDYDFLDSYYQQDVTFYISNLDLGSSSELYVEGTSATNQLPWNGTIDEWSLQIYALKALEESINIEANDSFGSVVAGPMSLNFTAPSTIIAPAPTTGGGRSTSLKHFSLNLIVPEDIIISDDNFILIPFRVQNNGQVDLEGINLSGFVRFNDEFTEDVKISLEEDYIDLLKQEESRNFTLQINANTQRAGKYKATIYANVSSPKLSDFGDFFIVLKKTNESAAEQLLVFTEGFLKSNSECLELTELFREAERIFELGNYSDSLILAQKVTEACEERINKRYQEKYPIGGFVEDNFYYISFSVLVMFFMGFILYIYKRVRFNKSKVEEYI